LVSAHCDKNWLVLQNSCKSDVKCFHKNNWTVLNITWEESSINCSINWNVYKQSSGSWHQKFGVSHMTWLNEGLFLLFNLLLKEQFYNTYYVIKYMLTDLYIIVCAYSVVNAFLTTYLEKKMQNKMKKDPKWEITE
jgi:hypothetical protein